MRPLCCMERSWLFAAKLVAGRLLGTCAQRKADPTAATRHCRSSAATVVGSCPPRPLLVWLRGAASTASTVGKARPPSCCRCVRRRLLLLLLLRLLLLPLIIVSPLRCMRTCQIPLPLLCTVLRLWLQLRATKLLPWLRRPSRHPLLQSVRCVAICRTLRCCRCRSRCPRCSCTACLLRVFPVILPPLRCVGPGQIPRLLLCGVLQLLRLLRLSKRCGLLWLLLLFVILSPLCSMRASQITCLFLWRVPHHRLLRLLLLRVESRPAEHLRLEETKAENKKGNVLKIQEIEYRGSRAENRQTTRTKECAPLVQHGGELNQSVEQETRTKERKKSESTTKNKIAASALMLAWTCRTRIYCGMDVK